MQKNSRLVKRSVALLFFVLVCCITYGQRRDVRFCPRQGANSASGWALVGIARNVEDSLWVSLVREKGGEPMEEWLIPGGRGVECLYLPPSPGGRYHLRASLRRGGPRLAEAVIVRSDTVMVFNCDANYFWIGTEGFLLDAVSGKPVRGAEVRVTDYESETLMKTILTDSVGAYRIEGLEPWKDYSVDAGTQGLGIFFQGDKFFRCAFFSDDTIHMVCRSFLPNARLVDDNGREVAVVQFEPNDLGIGEAMTVLPHDNTFNLIFNEQDTFVVERQYVPQIGGQQSVKTSINVDEEQYHLNQREIESIPSEYGSIRFRVVDYSGEPFRTMVHVDALRIGESHPWRMNTFISTPIGINVIHHSIDSAEFARRFPFILMDTLNRHSLSELSDFTIAASYDIDIAGGDTACVDLSKLDSGLYRIIVKMPLQEGCVDTIDELYFHYRTPGYRLGSIPFYADNISGLSYAEGDTLRVKVGSCYSGVTVLCQVEVNDKVVVVKQLRFDNNDTVISMPLRQRGVVQMKFLSMWHGEFVSWSTRAEVGRTRRDWYWDDLYPYETFDLSRQFIDIFGFK